MARLRIHDVGHQDVAKRKLHAVSQSELFVQSCTLLGIAAGLAIVLLRTKWISLLPFPPKCVQMAVFYGVVSNRGLYFTACTKDVLLPITKSVVGYDPKVPIFII